PGDPAQTARAAALGHRGRQHGLAGPLALRGDDRGTTGSRAAPAQTGPQGAVRAKRWRQAGGPGPQLRDRDRAAIRAACRPTLPWVRLRAMRLLLALALVAAVGCQPVGEHRSETPVAASPATPTSLGDPPAPTIVEIEIETGFGCVLDSAGSIRCWGDRRGPAGQPRPRWQLGDPSDRVAAAMSSVTCPHQGEPWICASLEPGIVECWRLFADGEHIQIPGIPGAVEVDQHSWTCARSKSGEVHCWTMDDVDAIQT